MAALSQLSYSPSELVLRGHRNTEALVVLCGCEAKMELRSSGDVADSDEVTATKFLVGRTAGERLTDGGGASVARNPA